MEHDLNAHANDTSVSANSWQALADDPNASDVMQMRREALRKAYSGFRVVERNAFFASRASGRTVLDIGVVNHQNDAFNDSSWLHGVISKSASYCLGVDILCDAIEQLREAGFNVLCHDVTRAPLNQKFELITCGEVLEHVGNLDGLFENCRTMLSAGGYMVLSTPNPWYLNPVVKNCIGSDVFVESVDHVAWFAPSEIYELGSRHGFELTAWCGTKGISPRSRLTRALMPLVVAALRPICRPAVFCKSLIYVLKATD